uniref:CHHC U11-48K-type domain-containing protein n=1 Tax=Culex tarsalis TaxID=7177 RepID=A0A1Q3F718_CULTA
MAALAGFKTLLECPYNKAHRVQATAMARHLFKCRKMYPHVEFATCPFNHAHRMPEPELKMHTAQCEDRANFDVYKYCITTAAATHTSTEAQEPELIFNTEDPINAKPVQDDDDECWDDLRVPAYNPAEYCEKAKIIRKATLMTPAEKRLFYEKENERHKILDVQIKKEQGIDTDSDSSERRRRKRSRSRSPVRASRRRSPSDTRRNRRSRSNSRFRRSPSPVPPRRRSPSTSPVAVRSRNSRSNSRKSRSVTPVRERVRQRSRSRSRSRTGGRFRRHRASSRSRSRSEERFRRRRPSPFVERRSRYEDYIRVDREKLVTERATAEAPRYGARYHLYDTYDRPGPSYGSSRYDTFDRSHRDSYRDRRPARRDSDDEQVYRRDFRD